MANNIKETLLTTAEEVLGKKRHKNKPWVTNEALDLCDKRREIKKLKHQSSGGKEKYRQANKEVRAKLSADKEKWIADQCDAIEKGMEAGNTKEAYRTLKALTKSNQTKPNVIKDQDGNLLTDNEEVMKRWTEYCNDLYNHQLHPDISILQTDHAQPSSDAELSILQKEVEAAVKSLKADKSPGIDNVPAELIKHGGEKTTEALTELCQKIWAQKKWPKEWTQSLVIPLPKKGNLKLCQNYRTISLISHPSKVMLRVILNRLKSKAEEILSEEQAGFRAKRSTVEQIFNCRILIEKHLQHQKDLLHIFIDFKKAFDRVWHDGLWQVLRDFSIEEGLVQVIQALYEDSNSAVLLNNKLGHFFPTTVGVRQGCLLSPVLFNLFLERIMLETLEDHHTSISIGGRPVCNLRFADDIDLMGGTNTELQDLTDRLDTRASAYGMEISGEKTKAMINSTSNTKVNINLKGQPLEEVDRFKYLGAILSKDGTCTAEIRNRIASATAALARLDRMWKSNISFPSKFKLYKALVVSILLYGCETWTILREDERRIQAFETKCLRRLLGISFREHRTNEYVLNTIRNLVGPQEPLLATIKRRKLAWFGHHTRHDSLSKTILQGTVEGGRRRGRPRLSWSDNIKDWMEMTMPELLSSAANRTNWRKTSASSALRPPRRLRESHGSE